MKIGLFFGSFNPVHTGHLIIANHMAEHTDLDRIWMVISPHSPHKRKESLANDHDRYYMVRLATEKNSKINPSKIEFDLPKPSYTIDTLAYLEEQHPEDEFVLIMGADNLASLHKWKNYEKILENYLIYVYKRPNYELGELQNHKSVKVLENTPLMEISATFIRSCLRDGKSIEYLVPDEVIEEIDKSNLYKK